MFCFFFAPFLRFQLFVLCVLFTCCMKSRQQNKNNSSTQKHLFVTFCFCLFLVKQRSQTKRKGVGGLAVNTQRCCPGSCHVFFVPERDCLIWELF